jgi:glycosyltransferase domain-containing protein
MISKCTILIPTFNRPEYLRRILSYYNGFEENYNIIVADSSSDESKLVNKKNMSTFLNLDIQHIDKYPLKIETSHKINDALNYVNAKYCVLCADDDFITPKGIKQSIDFLEKNSDFLCAQGHYISFHLRANKKGRQQFLFRSLYLGKQINFPEARYRLFYHLSNYQIPTFYAVHGTNLLKMIFKDTVEFTDDDRFGELLPTMLTLINGKMKILDVLYSAREKNYGFVRPIRKTFNDFIKNGTYDRKYNKFKNCLAEHLIKKSRMTSDEAKELIDKAMTEFLSKYYPKSFKHFFVSKMNKFFNAINLSEPVDRNIRMLYRKIFTSKDNFNKSKEMNNFKKKVENPNSKYFNDFEKISNHISLYAKKEQ